MNWEYMLEINLSHDLAGDSTEMKMLKLGAEGWELVSVVDVSTKTGGHNLAFFFKAPAITSKPPITGT